MILNELDKRNSYVRLMTTADWISKLAEDLNDNKLLTIANQLREHCIANKGDDTYL